MSEGTFFEVWMAVGDPSAAAARRVPVYFSPLAVYCLMIRIRKLCGDCLHSLPASVGPVASENLPVYEPTLRSILSPVASGHAALATVGSGSTYGRAAVLEVG